MQIHIINFKVKGVTFKNEDGKDIQKGIKSILNEYKKNKYFDSLYGGYTNKEIIEYDLNISEYENVKLPARLVGDEFKGEECLKIYLKTYNDDYFHVGYAPKENLEEIAEWLNRKDLKCDGSIEIIGGKYKHSEIEENEDYEEIEKVVIEELTYGLEVTLSFYNDEVDPNIQKTREGYDVTNNNMQNKGEQFILLKLIISFILIIITIICLINILII